MNVASGNQHTVFDIPDVGRFGVSICYDMWFPETTRTLAWMGAEVILHPSLTNTIDRDVEVAIARASAATNQCYFVDLNCSGHLGYGRSSAFGPGGEALYVAGTGREIIALELDLDLVTNMRERGWQGLGQPLKSFRDTDVSFPPYAPDAHRARCIRKVRTPRAPRRARQKIMRFTTMATDRRIPRSALSLAVAQALGAAAGFGLAGPALAQEAPARARARDRHGTAPRTGHPRRAVQHLGGVGRRDRAPPDLRFAGTAARHRRRRRRGPRRSATPPS